MTKCKDRTEYETKYDTKYKTYMVAPTIWYPYLVAYVAQHVILRIAASSRFDVDVVEDLEHCPRCVFVNAASNDKLQR